MVNITHKQFSLRKAIATGTIQVSDQATISAIQNRTVPKGDIFEFSRAAGLLACKKTFEVVPDCHPLPIEFTAITFTIQDLQIHIQAEVHTVYKTGVEVEAMHAVMITALTMYDMLKPIDQSIVIGQIQVKEKKGGKSDFRSAVTTDISAAIITCSDTISKGEGEDKSGKAVQVELEKYAVQVVEKTVIPDEIQLIQQEVVRLKEMHIPLILLTGGTGVSVRDHTPDAIRPLLDQEIPGIMEVARAYGQERMPYAMLSRGVAGFIGNSLVITLPGSVNGVKETMQAIFPFVLHVFSIRDGARHS